MSDDFRDERTRLFGSLRGERLSCTVPVGLERSRRYWARTQLYDERMSPCRI